MNAEPFSLEAAREIERVTPSKRDPLFGTPGRLLGQFLSRTALIAIAMAALSNVWAASIIGDKAQSQAPASLEVAAVRCTRALPLSESLHYEDVAIRGYTGPDQLKSLGESVYLGERRHPGAFYYSAERGSFIGRRNGNAEIRVPGAFIQKVLAHLSTALTQDYARSLYFADLGHGHLFITWEEYRNELEPLPAFSQQFYDVLLNSSKLMVIYHAAEQMLKVLDGRPLQEPASRYYIDRRNILGSFSDEPETSYLPPVEQNLHNTQNAIEGYTQFGGIEFTWNRNGCFPVRAGDRTVYLDLSFEGVPLRHPPTESEQ